MEENFKNPNLEHDRACEIIEREIDYENEYAVYELSKDWVNSKKRNNMSKILAFFVVILISAGE